MELNQAVKEERNAYFREWRKNNKEKVRQINAKYWKKRAFRKMGEEGFKKEGNHGAAAGSPSAFNVERFQAIY